jgi:hypothetical protein
MCLQHCHLPFYASVYGLLERMAVIPLAACSRSADVDNSSRSHFSWDHGDWETPRVMLCLEGKWEIHMSAKLGRREDSWACMAPSFGVWKLDCNGKRETRRERKDFIKMDQDPSTILICTHERQTRPKGVCLCLYGPQLWSLETS